MVFAESKRITCHLYRLQFTIVAVYMISMSINIRIPQCMLLYKALSSELADSVQRYLNKTCVAVMHVFTGMAFPAHTEYQ